MQPAQFRRRAGFVLQLGETMTINP